MIEVGKDVVANRDHSGGNFKRGQLFTCMGLRPSVCKCSHIEIDVGMRSNTTAQGCGDCKIVWYSEEYFWYDSICFTALDDITPSIEEIIKEKYTFRINDMKLLKTIKYIAVLSALIWVLFIHKF